MEMKIGFCPFIERYGPTDALKQAVEAEKVGFDSIWADDDFLPVPPMTESGFAWTWMSSALQATEKVFSLPASPPLPCVITRRLSPRPLPQWR